MKARLTLSQLAHFDHCIFPEDFRDDLIERGIDKIMAQGVANWLIDHENKPGIVMLWQVWARKDEQMAKAFDDMLRDWDKRFPCAE